MKKIFTWMLMAGFLAFTACGPSEQELREKAVKDSIRVADSLAALVVEAESWAVYKTGKDDQAGFKANYEGRKVLLKNLVVNGIWSGNEVIQCLAWSPSEMMVSNPSKEGDPKKKISRWEDSVQGGLCKFNTDLVSFAWYFKLVFKEPVDVSNIKPRDLKEEPGKYFCNYPTVLSVEGDSLMIESNQFVLKNCVIKEISTK
jgi:hypothetical protein